MKAPRPSGGGKPTMARRQGTPPGDSGVNKPFTQGRDFRTTAANGTIKQKTDQRSPLR